MSQLRWTTVNESLLRWRDTGGSAKTSCTHWGPHIGSPGATSSQVRLYLLPTDLLDSPQVLWLCSHALVCTSIVLHEPLVDLQSLMTISSHWFSNFKSNAYTSPSFPYDMNASLVVVFWVRWRKHARLSFCGRLIVWLVLLSLSVLVLSPSLSSKKATVPENVY